MVNRNVTKKMLNHYGWAIEKMVIVEELAELTQAISKMERGEGTMHNLVEEIADVYIVLDMIAERYKISTEMIEKMILSKENRNVGRLKKGNK